MVRPEETEAMAERERLARRYRDLLGEYKTVNAELTDVAWTLADLEQQIAALDATANKTSPHTQQRLLDLRRQRDALEEQALQRMYRAEAMAEELARLRAALAAADPGAGRGQAEQPDEGAGSR